jgi:hypothetical protein
MLGIYIGFAVMWIYNIIADNSACGRGFKGALPLDNSACGRGFKGALPLYYKK